MAVKWIFSFTVLTTTSPNFEAILMIYVDDTYYSADYFKACNNEFEQHPILKECAGTRLTVCMPNTAKWIALCLYLKAKGASVLPLPIDTPISAARKRAEKSQSHYLLFNSQNDERIDRIEIINKPEGNNEAHLSSNTAVLIQMSSGTTGEPKYIERDWRSIDIEVENYVKHFEQESPMTPIVACPVSHSYGLICGVFVAFKRGIEPIIIQNNNPKYIIKKIHETNTPILYSSPTLISTISMLIKEEQPIYAAMTSGTLMQKTWFDKVKSKVTHLYQQYGCSEAGCIAIAQDIHSVDQIGSGLPHLSIDAGPDAQNPSEIIVHKMDGQVIHTQDLGYFDDSKQLHFVSRLDDMINVSGFNVYPAEVEEVILDLSGINDALVFKRQHTFGHDIVCLHYMSQTPIEDSDIRQWCREKLSAHQIPMNITRVEHIPRLPNGKVSRKKIAQSTS